MEFPERDKRKKQKNTIGNIYLQLKHQECRMCLFSVVRRKQIKKNSLREK